MAKTPLDTNNKPVSFVIKFNGREINRDFRVFSIKVKEGLSQFSSARIEIIAGNATENLFEESEESSFKPGAKIEISLGFEEINKTVFKGVVSGQKISLRQGYANNPYYSILVLECIDEAAKLNGIYKDRIFTDQKDSQVMTTLIGETSVSKSVVATSFEQEVIRQKKQSNWDLIKHLCQRNGLVIYNSQSKVTIEEPTSSGSSIVTITQGKDVDSFFAEINSLNQIKGVKISGWDDFNNKSDSKVANEYTKLSKPGDLNSQTLGKIFHSNNHEFLAQSPKDASWLQEDANSMLFQSRIKRVRGEVTTRGLNFASVGKIATLKGFGSHFDGNVYISGLEHTVSEGDFKTKLIFGFPLFNNLAFENPSQKSEGLLIGTVKELDKDPKKENRIKVLLQGFESTTNFVWCKLSQMYVSKTGSSQFLPEIGTQVVVGFLHNETEFPVVLGCLYDKNNKPYEKFDKKNDIKSISTREKLTIEFDDKDKAITIVTPDKNSIVIDDKAKKITIKDSNDNQIETSSSGITITSKKDITLKASGKLNLTGSKGVKVDGGSSGAVKISGQSISADAKSKFSTNAKGTTEIKSTGAVNIKGSLVNLN